MATESKVEEISRQDSKSSMQNSLNETEITNSIKSLQEETQQISELVEMERSYSAEVSNQLKQIILPLNASYHIKPESISKNDSSISDAVLTPQGIVCVFYASGNVISRPLESITSEVLIRILSEVIPEAKILMNEKRQKLSGRVMMLEKLSKEMRKVPNTGQRSKQSLQGTPEQSPHTGKERPSQPQDAMRSVFGEK
ncbi:MAG: hypothetical protein JRN20_01405 [Nitrososphaerota archaeon]|nr:hypothetical protein [Nitrososphaerota archaeon]